MQLVAHFSGEEARHDNCCPTAMAGRLGTASAPVALSSLTAPSALINSGGNAIHGNG